MINIRTSMYGVALVPTIFAQIRYCVLKNKTQDKSTRVTQRSK